LDHFEHGLHLRGLFRDEFKGIDKKEEKKERKMSFKRRKWKPAVASDDYYAFKRD